MKKLVIIAVITALFLAIGTEYRFLGLGERHYVEGIRDNVKYDMFFCAD